MRPEQPVTFPFSKGIIDGLRLAGCGALFVIPFAMLLVWSGHLNPFLTGKTVIFRDTVLIAASISALLLALGRRAPSGIVVVFALVVACMAFADFAAHDLHSAVWGEPFRQAGLIGLIALLAFLMAVDGIRPGPWLIRAWAASSTMAALTGIAQAVIVTGVGGNYGRVWGVIGQPVFLGALVGLGMIFSVWAHSLSLSARGRWLWRSALAVQLAGVYLTSDRSALAALLAASLIGCAWDKRFILSAALFAGLLGFNAVWHGLPGQSAVATYGSFQGGGISAPVHWRLNCWHGEWTFASLKPWLGYGQENTHIQCVSEIWDRAHNFVLQYLLDGGIFALAAFLFFIFRSALKMLSLAVAFPLMVLGAYLVITAVEPDSLLSQLPMLTAVGFAWRGA